jgi:hypothetical protein
LNNIKKIKVMMQRKEIGKKRDWNSARVGKTFVSPLGREYTYGEGGRGIIVIEYLGQRMQVKTRDFKNTDIDSLLKAIEREVFVDSDIPDSVIDEQIDMLLEQDWDERDVFNY